MPNSVLVKCGLIGLSSSIFFSFHLMQNISERRVLIFPKRDEIEYLRITYAALLDKRLTDENKAQVEGGNEAVIRALNGKVINYIRSGATWLASLIPKF